MANEIEAIATNNYVLATQQAVTHDNSMSGNGTVDSPLGLNETVLWEGTYSGTSAIPFTEPYKNFEYTRIDFKRIDNLAFSHTFNTSDQTFSEISLFAPYCRGTTAGGISILCSQYSLDNSSMQWKRGAEVNVGANASNASANKIILTKVVGINRKAQ